MHLIFSHELEHIIFFDVVLTITTPQRIAYAHPLTIRDLPLSFQSCCL
jgi:hypothetical protein